MTDFVRFPHVSWQSTALALFFAVSSTLSPFWSSAHAAAAPTAALRSDGADAVERTLALFDLAAGGRPQSVRLTGLAPSQTFEFGVRRDEVISSARVHLVWTSSPSLVAGKSQLNAYLNGRLVKSIPLEASSIGQTTALDVDLTGAPLQPAGNRLRLELIGHYQTVCENDTHSSLWLEVTDDSTLTLAGESVRIANDLSVLPAPFVDAADPQAAVVPMVFAASPDEDTRTAAAITAGAVGAVSAWKGSRFPVFYNDTPAKGHFIVFATNAARPDFLKALPPFEAPQILLTDAPASGYEKMLVIAAPTSEGLIAAARALSERERLWIGPRAVVTDDKAPEPLAAYAAPNWVSADEPVPLARLLQYPEQSVSRGKIPGAVTMDLRLAPDLTAVSGARAEMRLLWRYSRDAQNTPVDVNVYVNGAVASVKQSRTAQGRGAADVELPVAAGPLAMLSPQKTLEGLAHNTHLAIAGNFTASASDGTPENCRSTTLPEQFFQVDPSSMLSFRGLYHYAVLPETALFTQGGFPFTKYPDLAQTALVTAPHPDEAVLSTLLTAVARMSAQTGTAPVLVRAYDADKITSLNKDILAVGMLPASVVQADAKTARQLETGLVEHLVHPEAGALERGQQTRSEEFETSGFAALVSTRAPGRERSLVALLGEDARGLELLQKRLANPSDLWQASGGTVFLTDDTATGFDPHKTWTVGSMPWVERVWLSLSDRPLMLVLAALAAAFAAGAILFLTMRRITRDRAASRSE